MKKKIKQRSNQNDVNCNFLDKNIDRHLKYSNIETLKLKIFPTEL